MNLLNKIRIIFGNYWHKFNNFIVNLNILFLAFFNKKKVVYVFGDSHVDKFIGHRYCFVKPIASCTAFKLNSFESTTNSRKKLFFNLKNLPDGSVVLMVFGEIDARVHIYKQFIKNKKIKSISKLSAEIVNQYMCVLKDLRKMGFTVLVHGIPPPTDKDISKFGLKIPLTSRVLISKTFNSKLKKACFLENYPYWDLYDFAVTKKNILKIDYAFDEIHLNKATLTNYDSWVLKKLGDCYVA